MNRNRSMGLIAAALLVASSGLLASADTGEPEQAHDALEFSVAAGGAATAIGLPPGRVVTVSLFDAEGRPWQAVEIEGPTADWLSYRRAAVHSHVLFLESRQKRGSGNLVALLEGLAAPVHLALAADASATATQVAVRLTDARRDASPSADAPAGAAPRGIAGALAGTDLDAAIREYLLANPEVLREALDPARQLASKVRAHRAELLSGDGVPVLGDADAPVTVVEFFDYRCGFCKRSLEAVRAAASRSGVRVQMREYPILGEDSQRAARIALAAARQGAYEGAHFALMAHDGDYGEATAERIAADLSLDLERLRADMSSPEVDALIAANREMASRLGVTGTPAFLVLGPERVEISPGALDTDRLNALIDSAG